MSDALFILFQPCMLWMVNFFSPRFSGAAVCQSLLHELAGRAAVLGRPAEDLGGSGFEVIQHTPHWMGWHLATSNDFKMGA